MAYGDLKVNNLIYDTGSGDATRTVVSIPQIASPTFTGTLTVDSSGNVYIKDQGDLRFGDADSSHYVGFQAPATVTSNLVWTLPAADGTNGQQLSTNGSGVLSWTDATNVAAASLSGTTMASNVVTSSLTTLGTLTGLTVNGDVTFTGASSNGLWDKSANAFVANLTGDVTGDLTGTADVATAVTVADESSDTTCNVLFTTAATGNLPPKSGTNLTFNSNTGILTATGFAGALTGNVTGDVSGASGTCSGNAATATIATNITVADESSDTTCYPVFVTHTTGNLPPKTGSNLAFNSDTGALTATSFVGDLTGAVTGTASGNAVLTGSTNNQIVTVTGANAIQGEAKLTFDGATLDFAINNSQQGIKIGAVGNHIPLLSFDSDRTAAGDNVGQQKFFWDGTEVARIAGLSGGDTTNKDDGKLAFYTRASGSSLALALTLNTDQSATFAGKVSDSKGDVRKIPYNGNSGAYTLVAADAGKVVGCDSAWTIPASVFSEGDTVTLLNLGGSGLGITASALTTLYNTADGANIKASTLSLGARGMATIWFASGTSAFIQSAALTVS